jgi:hypothetical protein
MMILGLEQLEDRAVPSLLAPVTPWHYAPAANFAAGSYNAPGDPGSAGFNLVDVTAPSQLALVPAGDKALVDLGAGAGIGSHGVDAAFLAAIRPYLGDPRVFGFYLADEPNPAVVPASNLETESDWIHANDPGAKTFIVLGPGPFFPGGYTPYNTHIDLVGLDPYPVRTWGTDYRYLPLAVLTAEWFDGWSRDQIVPVYQAFGGVGSFVTPNALEEEVDLLVWGVLTPHPAFDYAYSWGEWGAQSLVDRPDLQLVFAAQR